MLISHEVPLDLLDDSNNFNDYDYMLFHLLHIPEYKDFYKKSTREIYFDNSAYEFQFLQEKFSIGGFYKAIDEIKPSVVIVPDALGDKVTTIQNFKDFDLGIAPDKIMGVVQGASFKELHECFDFMNPRCDIVAIPFHSEAYIKRFYNSPKDTANAIGRVKFIRELVLRHNVRPSSLHLIGMSLPVELSLYDDDLEFIRSIDTANPVQFGLLEQLYPVNIDDIISKPKYVMTSENIIKETNQKQAIMIKKNIETFRSILKIKDKNG